jgi:2-oxoisovalerate dehydrogenase E1 component alpha subunit
VDDDDDEVDQEWTAVKPTKKPLGLGKAPVGILTTKQKDQRNDNENTSNNTWSSPLELLYTGNHKVPITSKLHIVTPQQDTPRGIWPVFRIMDENGYFRDATTAALSNEQDDDAAILTITTDDATDLLDTLRRHLMQHAQPHLQEYLQSSTLLQQALHEYPDVHSKNTLLRVFIQMSRLREMDEKFQNAQRQGRISFYMTCTGEEAIHLGAASALSREDTVLAQYREAGILMWRGFTLEQFANQCFSNDADLGKGRQMPVHYGSRALNYHTISSPLGTQLPQAVGVAYHSKLSGHPTVTACFFGDGCASTTDFHSALNFAATLQVPVLFICRNNGYAISTPVSEQYAGDGIVSRAPGYGMAGIRVDGNDVFAMHAAVAACKKYALEHSAPVLMECMTFRQGHHSTSDDSTRYRPPSSNSPGDPLERLQAFLRNYNVVDESWMATVRDDEKMKVLRAMEQAERRPSPPLEEMFQDVYHEIPPHLQRQEEELHQHVAKYPDRYKQKNKTH